jgi:hypothetical protein
MVPMTELWLPILLSAVSVFFASSIFHMVLPLHKKDYKKLPNEDKVLEALRGEPLETGMYPFPYCLDPKDMGKPEVMAKFKQGPVGFVTVAPTGLPAMGKLLGSWFVFSLALSAYVAYIAGRTLSPDATYLAVFRVVGAIAFLGYSGGQFIDSIWKSEPWSNTFRHVFDGLVYALLTAGVFGWLWP